MKTIPDICPNASAVLAESLEFEQRAIDMAAEAAPYSVGGKGRPMPKFLKETALSLNSLLVTDFEMTFAGLSEMIVNGDVDSDGFDRLNDACSAFNEVQHFLKERRCVLRTEQERTKAYSMLCQVIGDLVIFVAIQFKFDMLEEEQITLAVQTHCERAGITSEVLKGLLYQDLSAHGQSWYAWEVISPLYEDLMNFDPNLVSEFREAFFPLSDETAELLVSGKMDSAIVRNQLADFLAKTEEVEADGSPASMVKSMKLN